MLSGSYDYTVRMYDFQGMNSKLQSFRQLEPFEGHQVRSLSWSPTSDRFLCVTGSAQAKVFRFSNLSDFPNTFTTRAGKLLLMIILQIRFTTGMGLRLASLLRVICISVI